MTFHVCLSFLPLTPCGHCYGCLLTWGHGQKGMVPWERMHRLQGKKRNLPDKERDRRGGMGKGEALALSFQHGSGWPPSPLQLPLPSTAFPPL